MIINLNTATGTQYLWKQERIILRGAGQGFAPLYIWTNLHGSQAQPLARYEQAGGFTYADITDYVRAYPNVSKIYYTDDLSDPQDFVELAVHVQGLINPANDIIPFNCEAVATQDPLAQGAPDLTGLLVTPPRMILQPITGEYVNCETRIKNGYSQRYSVSPSDVIFDEQGSTIEIPSTATGFGIWDDVEQLKAFDYVVTPRNSELNYVTLDWVSRYGVVKAAVWEMKNLKYATGETVNIESLNNEYDTRKGVEISFTAQLEGLTAYDYWYYADIINSSRVSARINGVTRNVSVDTKDVTIPNTSSGEFKTLEITIKLAKFDAI